MISLKLWRSLLKPPGHHPLFRHVLLKAKREDPRVTSNFVTWALMLSGVTFVVAVLIKPVMWIILTLLLALNSLYPLRQVLRISRTIAHEKETRRFDLLASLPAGLLGASWALATGVLHRRTSFRWMPYLVLITAIVASIAICGISTVMLTLLEQLSDNDMVLAENLMLARYGIIVIPFLILFYIDHIYSILTATVFGQIVTIDVNSATEGQVRGLLGFLVIQLMTYTVSLWIALLIVPELLVTSGFTEVQHLIITGFTGIIVFIMLRELIISVLWHHLTASLNADTGEIELVLQPVYQAEVILKESEKARVRYMVTTGRMESDA